MHIFIGLELVRIILYIRATDEDIGMVGVVLIGYNYTTFLKNGNFLGGWVQAFLKSGQYLRFERVFDPYYIGRSP